MVSASVFPSHAQVLQKAARTPEMLSNEEATLITSRCLECLQFEVLDVETASVGKRSGFMSDYVRIRIRVRTEDKEDELQFFAKTVPRERLTHKKFIEETQAYLKEVSFYNDVMNRLYKYQLNAFNGKSKICPRSKWAPYCYYARSDAVVMEDLSLGGFEVAGRREVMTWELCVAILTELASFHAATIIFEEREKKKIVDECPDVFSNAVLDTALAEDSTKGWYPAGRRALIALIPLLKRYQNNAGLQKTIQNKIPSVCDSIFPLFETAPFRKVACHGDLWASNILVQRRRDDREPPVVRFVDFQLLRYAAPGSDVAIFLYCNTDADFRRRHFRSLVDGYAAALRSELTRHGIDATAALPADEIRTSCEAFRRVGCVIACLYYQLTLMPEKDHDAFHVSSEEQFNKFFLEDRESEVRECFEKDEVFRSRMEEVLYELTDTYILKEK